MSEAPPITLISHAGAYGGVATHLNQFIHALGQVVFLRHLLFFTVNKVSIGPVAHLPTPQLRKAPHTLQLPLLLRIFSVPVFFLWEIFLSLREADKIRGKHIVLTSHDPNAFWGFVAFCARADYFLYVLPELKETNGIKRTIRNLWRKGLNLLVTRRMHAGRLRLITPTAFAAKTWAEYLGIDAADIHLFPSPPFLASPCPSVILDTQPSIAEVDRITGQGLKLILTVGHMEEYKGPRLWLRIAKHLHEQSQDYGFVWAGDGPLLEEMRQAAAGYPRIFLPGRVNQEDMRKLYKASGLLFHPAIKESQGIVIMDALTFGLPVIVNNSEAPPTLIAGSDAGVVMACDAPDAPEGFAKIIRKLEDGSFYQHASESARTLAAQRYPYQAWTDKLKSLYLTGNHG